MKKPNKLAAPNAAMTSLFQWDITGAASVSQDVRLLCEQSEPS
jgi:hypothetical protein